MKNKIGQRLPESTLVDLPLVDDRSKEPKKQCKDEARKQELGMGNFVQALLDGPVRRKKDGSLYKSSVRYEVTSIRCCHLFPPQLLARIIKDPYRFFNVELSKVPFDHWCLVTVRARANGNDMFDFTFVDVTDLKGDPTLFLH